MFDRSKKGYKRIEFANIAFAILLFSTFQIFAEQVY